ncbi:MAG TPA: alpha/beta hydrolase [Gallionella sp.]|nr:alpha/beta hydrolase [Gallionella sp.]
MATTDSAIRIAYDDQGRGEPALLCLAGWCADRSAFADLVSACSPGRCVLSLDWRGHGQSASALGDFGEAGLIEDAMTVIRESGAHRFIPVALAHASWIAIELRRQLGARIPAIVFVDSLVLDPPPPFLGALADLQDSGKWESTRDQLFAMWLHDVENPKVTRLVQEGMGSHGFEMWARAGREIETAYRRYGSPLKALAEFHPPVPVLHLYAQPVDLEFLRAQETFSEANPWFSVMKLNAKSHFPMLELPEDRANTIEAFLARNVH